MSMRVLVTGCGGFVGGAIVHQAPPDIELHAITGKRPLCTRPGLAWHIVDLRDATRVTELIRQVAPTSIIHAAAIADIDFCQNNRDVAWDINVGITQRIADLCAERDIRLVYVSTDNVFDGKKGAYTESEPPNPINFYAETKTESERIASSPQLNSVVARPSVVMGLPLLGSGNSFLSRMLPVLREGKALGVPENEVRSPVDVITLARSLLELSTSDDTGIIHLAGNDALNRLELVRAIARRISCSADLVYPNNPELIPGRAPRPLDVSLCNKKARRTLVTPMLNIDQALDLILTTKPESQGA